MTQNNRTHARYDTPPVGLHLEIPALSDSPIVPEDISAGGAKVRLPRKPEFGEEYETSIWIGGTLFGRHAVESIRIEQSEDDPGNWTVGLRLLMPDSARERLLQVFQHIPI